MKIIWTFTLLMIPGYPGGKGMIKCTYQKKFTQNTKYFCRGKMPKTPLIGWCSDLIKTKEKDKWFDSGRFSLYDDTTAAVFNVTIRNLSEQDSGTYQCAVDIRNFEDSYTEVNITVASPPTTPSSITTPPISLNSQPSTSDFTSDSPSVSNGSSLIIIVSVVLLLLIVGLVSCIVTVCMKRQARAKGSDSASKMPEPRTENSEVVPQTLYIYEEIKDTRPHPDCKTAQLPTITTVYATPQLPTSPSVEWHKQCKNQLPTNPSDSCTVYATPGLPINPSDSTKTVYATPQLPTNPSDSMNTVYATV
ncbi:CMRF35-like molecule 2 isoform X2 [Onychostoma macrolepis]|uniref:CMRF35-like molecule 2 isoform X2 n=1 Tax=Onychostoma macrolepis TaxID=369639 RepID=UPI00272CDB01|nr:CMRF35-like molecule 2 isoform X2 [Onychostoma macrolepis]